MPNNTLIGAVRAEASLEGGKFVSGAKKIQQSAKQTETQLKKSFGVMGAAVKGFGLSLASGLTIGLLGSLIKKSLDYAGSIAEVAQQLGVTSKDLQVFRYAAGQVGVKQEQLETGLSKLTITLGKVAAGAKAPTEALKAIGISADQIKGKDTGEAFRMIADGLQKVTDRSQRAAVEVALFGKSGAMLDNLLSGGSSALNELSAAAERLGIVLSDEQIQKADETADKLEAVKTMLSAQIAGVVADNADSILKLANALLEVSAAAGNALANVGKFVNFISANIGWLANPTAMFGVGMAGPGSSATVGLNTVKGKYYDPTDFSLRDFKKRGSGGISPFLAPKSGGGRKSRTPRAPRDRSDDVSFQFDQELMRTHMDVLRAQQSLAHTSEDRAAISLKLLDAERQMQEAELQDRVRRAERDFAEGKITAGTLEQVKAQAEALRATYDEADALQRKAIAEDLAADKAHDAADLVDYAYDLRLEQLQDEASLAETASERREVELRILELMKEQEKARLDAVIADSQASDLAKAQAQQRLDVLNGIYAGRAAGVMQGTRGPMEDWLASLPTTAAKAQEAFERLEVQGFEGLIDAAVALTDGFDSAKDALLNTLKQFLLGLARMQLQQALGGFIQGGGFGSMLGGLFGSGSFGGGMSDVGFGFASQGSLVGLPQFARGGSFRVRGIPGIDRNTLMLNGIPIANVSYGERLSVSNDNGRDRFHGRSGDVNFNLYGLTDGDSFRRNERQIGRTTRRALGIKQ